MHGTLPRPQGRLAEGRFSDWRLAAKSILGFWIVYGLTVVARALLAADPTTILTNRLVVIAVGSILTGLIYAAIATFAAGRSIRRKAIVAGIASIAASAVMSGTLMALEDMMKESKEQYRYQAREGFVIVQEGHTVRVERHAQEPLVLTLPKVRELDANKRLRYVAEAVARAAPGLYLEQVAELAVVGDALHDALGGHRDALLFADHVARERIRAEHAGEPVDAYPSIEASARAAAAKKLTALPGALHRLRVAASDLR